MSRCKTSAKILAALVLAVSMTLLPVSPGAVHALSAQCAILIDGHAGRVLQEKSAHERRGMASTTKIMTAIVAIEKCDMDQIIQVSTNASHVEGSSMWLSEGERISMRDLLYGLMLNSGNDAATAIAEAVGGSVEQFAELMNQKAEQLQLKDTHFTNPHGLAHEQHYTTAYDLAQLTLYALKNPTFREIVSTRNKIVSWDGHEYGRHLTNHNKMLRIYEGADGVKTGFTKKDGRCLVSSATRDDMTLIVVTLNAGDDWNDHKTLLNYGFDNYKKHKVIAADVQLKTIPVSNKASGLLAVSATQDVEIVASDSEIASIDIEFDLPYSVAAPFEKGQVIGEAYVNIDGERVAAVQLQSHNELKDRSPLHQIVDAESDNVFHNIINKIKDIFK